jgi:hypothetical protein
MSKAATAGQACRRFIFSAYSHKKVARSKRHGARLLHPGTFQIGLTT